MGQQGSRPDVNAVTELPAAGGRPRVDLELKEVTDVDVAVATSSQSGKLKREVGRPPSSHERGTDRLPPAKPVSPSGVRPPSQGGRPRGRDTQQGLLLKSNQLRHTATVLAEESSPPPTRPGTAASLVSVNAAVRHSPQRYRVELPGQMPDIRGDPSPPPSQPASLALRSRPGTSQNSQLLSTQFTAAKAFARPSSSGNESPAVQPLPLAVTLKGPGTAVNRRNAAGRSCEAEKEPVKDGVGFDGSKMWPDTIVSVPT